MVPRQHERRLPFKVDDDCFINLDAFGFLTSTLSGHYIGKVIKRGLGGGRNWHQDKSSTEFAKQTPDLSPDKSVYCDGGIGYFLSRAACREILLKYNTLQGRILAEHSFYEDKLIGDLLAGSDFSPSDPSLPYANRRRNQNSEVPVAKWGANILPSEHASTYLTHTDNFKDVERLYNSQTSTKHGFNELVFDFGKPANSKNLNAVEVIQRQNSIQISLCLLLSVITSGLLCQPFLITIENWGCNNLLLWITAPPTVHWITS